LVFVFPEVKVLLGTSAVGARSSIPVIFSIAW